MRPEGLNVERQEFLNFTACPCGRSFFGSSREAISLTSDRQGPHLRRLPVSYAAANYHAALLQDVVLWFQSQVSSYFDCGKRRAFAQAT